MRIKQPSTSRRYATTMPANCMPSEVSPGIAAPKYFANITAIATMNEMRNVIRLGVLRPMVVPVPIGLYDVWARAMRLVRFS